MHMHVWRSALALPLIHCLLCLGLVVQDLDTLRKLLPFLTKAHANNGNGNGNGNGKGQGNHSNTSNEDSLMSNGSAHQARPLSCCCSFVCAVKPAMYDMEHEPGRHTRQANIQKVVLAMKCCLCQNEIFKNKLCPLHATTERCHTLCISVSHNCPTKRLSWF